MSVHTDKQAVADADWVAQNLDAFESDDPEMRLLEVDMDPSVYDQEHIPGAVQIDWESDFAGKLGRDIVGRDEFEELVGSLGITADSTAVIYGDKANWFAAHAYWVFTYYGHEDVRLLDGGRHYWQSQGYPTSTETPSFTTREYVAETPDESIRAYKDEVLEAVEQEAAIIDVRNPKEYRGESPPADIPETTEREGHIPGAKNVPWGEAVNFDGTFKSEAELREVYDEDVADPEDRTVAYCRIGERSSLTWFVLHELLDVDAANYDGSWTEWADAEDTPVEQGRQPTNAPLQGDD